MKRFLILFLIAAATLFGCDKPTQTPADTSVKTEEQKSAEQEKTAKPSPTIDDVQELLNKKQGSLKKIDALLVQRTAQRDAAKTAFLQIIRGKEIAPEEIMAQLKKSTSELEKHKWFLDAKLEFQKWELYEKSIVLHTLQKERLLKNVQKLELALENMKLKKEDAALYLSEDDAEFDEIMAPIDVDLNMDNFEKYLSEGKIVEIATEADKSMNEAVKKNASRIPGLTLKSIDDLPTFPDIKTLVNEPSDSVQNSLFKKVIVDVNKNIKTAREKTQTFIDNKQADYACNVWLQTIEEIKKVVNAAQCGNFDSYLNALDECHNSTLVIMSKPYAKSLSSGIKSLEGENPDWETVAESMEGLYNIHPEYAPEVAQKMEKLLQTVHVHLNYLKKLDGFNERVLQQRLETSLNNWEKEIHAAKAADLYKQAVKLRAKGDSDNALKLLNDAIRLDPGNKRYSEEKQAIEKSVHKAQADELYKQAVTLHSQEKYAEAMFKIEEALGMFPDNYMYQIEKKDIEEAQRTANVEDVYNQAVELRKNNKPREALAKINEALAVSPNDSKYLKEKKAIENALELLKAEELYKQAIELRTQNKPDEALEMINKALEIDPNNSDFKKEKQTIVKRIQSKPGTRKVVTVNGVDFAFRWCPPGTFLMGAPEWEKNRQSNETQHKVTLTKGFWIMETEVTQKQWKAILEEGNPSGRKDDDRPVENINPGDVQRFIKKCAHLGFSVDLPTEAQWEYACRAGSTTAFSWGDAFDGTKANCNDFGGSHPVGSYPPNAWGIYDMHGNVSELCKDGGREYTDKSVTDPVGPIHGSYRGGCFQSGDFGSRSASRAGLGWTDLRYSQHGFRCILAQ